MHRDAAVMVDETEAMVNDLLARWHRWSSSFRPVPGFNTCSAAMQQYLASRQYDSENGALDQDVENRTMAAMDACVEVVEQPYRTALYINARNLCTGSTVWRSARLPSDDMQRAMMVVEARARLMRVLHQRGLL